jgi:hypothetical protein
MAGGGENRQETIGEMETLQRARRLIFTRAALPPPRVRIYQRRPSNPVLQGGDIRPKKDSFK